MNVAFPIIISSLLTTPIFVKYISSCSLGNCSIVGNCSKRKEGNANYVSIGSNEAIGHTFIGIGAGLLMSPMSLGINNSWFDLIRSIAAFVIIALYPIYNIIKRGIKHKEHFHESSFFINLADVIVGIIMGYIIGCLIFMIQGNKIFYIVDQYIQYISIILLIIWLIIVLYLTISTRNVTICDKKV